MIVKTGLPVNILYDKRHVFRSVNGKVMYFELGYDVEMNVHIPGNKRLSGTWKPLGFNLWRKL